MDRADRYALGVDSGGTGVRVALTPVRADGTVTYASPPVVSDLPVPTGPGGIDADALAGRLVPAARELLARADGGGLAAVCVGAAGMATLGDGLRARLPGVLAEEFGAVRVALAADAVTAYAGALGQRPGAVVAAGTGLIGVGTDLTGWRRADGWGHLLGDCGGGAWIGRAGLEAALRAHDGRAGGSAALLRRLEAVFGSAARLPGLLYPRTDRPAVLASFAPEVAACAAEGDPVAGDILREAARHIAQTAAAVCPDRGAGAPPESRAGAAREAGAGVTPAPGTGETPGPVAGLTPKFHARTTPEAGAGVIPDPGTGATPKVRFGAAPEVALTGGLLRMGEPLLVPLHEQFAEVLPHARRVGALGSPLDGALLIAAALATDTLSFPHDPGMLYVSGHQTR